MRKPGDWIHGKYQVEKILGCGGMGTVYATRRRNESRAAVKVLHPRFAHDKAIRARFVEEGYLANRVGHPAVVTILEDDIDEQGNFYLVMELLDGVDLSAFCGSDRRRMSVAQALSIADQLLVALAIAHHKGIIHRDIKPANVMILRDGRVKLLDFGIAKALLPDGSLGLDDDDEETLGTDRFMSPEQGNGMFDAIDARSDIWAVGALLLELLSEQDAGEVPLWDMGYEDRMWAMSRLGDTHPQVVQIISKALQVRKQDRWASADLMRAAVVTVHDELFGPASVNELTELAGGDAHLSASQSEGSMGAVPAEPSDPTVVSRPSQPVPSRPLLGSEPGGDSEKTEPRATQSHHPRSRRRLAWVALSLLLVIVLVFGLSRMSEPTELKKTDQAVLEVELDPPAALHPPRLDKAPDNQFVTTSRTDEAQASDQDAPLPSEAKANPRPSKKQAQPPALRQEPPPSTAFRCKPGVDENGLSDPFAIGCP